MKDAPFKTIGYVGQIFVAFVSLYLFYHVAHDLALYDIEYSEGSDDARWRIDGTLNKYDIYGLIFWGIYLISTCSQLLLYFRQLITSDKECSWWSLPTFNIGKSNTFSVTLSFLFSATFLVAAIWFDSIMPEVFMPQITYSEMKELHYGYPGIDSFEAATIRFFWFIFTLFSTIHLFVYSIMALLRKRNEKTNTL